MVIPLGMIDNELSFISNTVSFRYLGTSKWIYQSQEKVLLEKWMKHYWCKGGSWSHIGERDESKYFQGQG